MHRALLAVVIAACAATACLTPPDTADAGVDGGHVDAACGTAAECACSNDSDCVRTMLFKDINSPADCYCPSCCPAETNSSTAAARSASYETYCSDFDRRWPDGGGCGTCSVLCPANQPVCDQGTCKSAPPR